MNDQKTGSIMMSKLVMIIGLVDWQLDSIREVEAFLRVRLVSDKAKSDKSYGATSKPFELVDHH